MAEVIEVIEVDGKGKYKYIKLLTIKVFTFLCNVSKFCTLSQKHIIGTIKICIQYLHQIELPYNL